MKILMSFGIKNQKGFTLIEVLSTILILGILAAVAIPSFDPSTASVVTAAATVETDIRYVQETAMAHNPANPTDVSITFPQTPPGTPTGSYSYLDTTPLATGSSLFNKTRKLPADVRILTPNLTIGFNRHGEPNFTSATVSVEVGYGNSECRFIDVQRFTGRASVRPCTGKIDGSNRCQC